MTLLPPPPGFRGRFITGTSALEPYAGASGILAVLPRAAALPANASDVAKLVRWAAEHRTGLVPRAAGTGMPGGNLGPGVVVDLRESFREVISIDPGRRRACIQPGVTLAQLNQKAERHGLRFPVDPASGDSCTLGGMIANNSAGARSVKYGATRSWVEWLDVILADGTRSRLARGRLPEGGSGTKRFQLVWETLEPDRQEIIRSWPRVRKNSSGYALKELLETGDPVELMVGSEGTLGLIVEAGVRLAPVPAATGTALLEFASLEEAGEAVAALLPLEPAACELMDRTLLEFVRKSGSFPIPIGEAAEAVLLVDAEGDSENIVQDRLAGFERAASTLARSVTAGIGPEQRAKLRRLRHATSQLISAGSGGRVSMQFIEDGVVPVARLSDYARGLREVLERHRLPAVIFGHAGDGNLHVNPLVNVSQPGWREVVERVLEESCELVARLGGTLSGEHGDGRLRAPLLERIWGREMVARFRAVKEAFDAEGTFNPGVILPQPGQQPLDALRKFPVA